MTLRAIVTNCLANLVLTELANHYRTNNQRHHQCGEGSKNSSQGQILKYRQRGKVLRQSLCQPEQHELSTFFLIPSTTRSIAELREPFTSTVADACFILTTASTASLCV